MKNCCNFKCLMANGFSWFQQEFFRINGTFMRYPFLHQWHFNHSRYLILRIAIEIINKLIIQSSLRRRTLDVTYAHNNAISCKSLQSFSHRILYVTFNSREQSSISNANFGKFVFNFVNLIFKGRGQIPIKIRLSWNKH